MQTYVEHILKTTSMNVEMEKKYQHQIYGSQTFSIRSDCLAFFCVYICVCAFCFPSFLLLIVFQKLINTIRNDPVAVNVCNAAVTLLAKLLSESFENQWKLVAIILFAFGSHQFRIWNYSNTRLSPLFTVNTLCIWNRMCVCMWNHRVDGVQFKYVAKCFRV